jgi:hypothetical protein
MDYFNLYNYKLLSDSIESDHNINESFDQTLSEQNKKNNFMLDRALFNQKELNRSNEKVSSIQSIQSIQSNQPVQSIKSETSSKLIDRLVEEMGVKINKSDNKSNNILLNNMPKIECLPQFKETFNNDFNNDTNLFLNENFENESTKDHFKHIKPLDSILINPIIIILKPIFRFFNYKSYDTGLISLSSYAIALFCIYYNKKNMIWFYLFIGAMCQYIDKLVYNNKKVTIKTINKHSLLYLNEQLNILIKISGFIVIYIFLSFADISNYEINKQGKQSVYLLLFLSIILLLLVYHTKKNYDHCVKESINKQKRLFNKREEIKTKINKDKIKKNTKTVREKTVREKTVKDNKKKLELINKKLNQIENFSSVGKNINNLIYFSLILFISVIVYIIVSNYNIKLFGKNKRNNNLLNVFILNEEEEE